MRVYLYTNELFLFFQVIFMFFTLMNSEDPDEMPHLAHFMWVITVDIGIRLGVSIIQRVNPWIIAQTDAQTMQELACRIYMYAHVKWPIIFR